MAKARTCKKIVPARTKGLRTSGTEFHSLAARKARGSLTIMVSGWRLNIAEWILSKVAARSIPGLNEVSHLDFMSSINPNCAANLVTLLSSLSILFAAHCPPYSVVLELSRCKQGTSSRKGTWCSTVPLVFYRSHVKFSAPLPCSEGDPTLWGPRSPREERIHEKNRGKIILHLQDHLANVQSWPQTSCENPYGSVYIV